MVKTITDPKLITDWLTKFTTVKPSDYVIYKDGQVDVYNDCHVQSKLRNLKYIPVKFGLVEGTFSLNESQLRSLENCPHKVGKELRIYDGSFTNLSGAPHEVGEKVIITDVQSLRSLEGFPSLVGRSITLRNLFMYSSQLQYLPRTVNGALMLYHMHLLKDLKGLPESIKDHLDLRNTALRSLEGFTHCGGDLVLDYELTMPLLRCLQAAQGIHLVNKQSHEHTPHEVPVKRVERVLNEFTGQGKAAALKAALALKQLGKELDPDASENMLQHNARW